LSEWKGRLDVARAIVGGHSMGGATAIAALHQLAWPRAGILLDAWMLPLQETVLAAPSRPVLAVNSENFTKWASNFSPLESYVAKAQENTGAVFRSWLLTIRESAHQNQSDFPLLFPWTMKQIRAFAGQIDPVRAMWLNNAACIAFMRKAFGEESGVKWPEGTEWAAVLSGDEVDRPKDLLYH